LELTAQAMAGLAWGLPFFAIEIVIMNYFYAGRRMIAPLVCGMMATGVAIAALPWLAARFGLAGVSAYLSLGRTVKIALLGFCLHQMNVRMSFRPAVAFTLKLAGALAIAALIHAGVQAALPPGPWGRRILPLLAVSSVLTLTGFFAAACLLGLEECRWAARALLQRGRMQVGSHGGNSHGGCAGQADSHAVLQEDEEVNAGSSN
jgi:peptidoglycan biosynthesis protein MviN/MurJ (putative lipid II flippase)